MKKILVYILVGFGFGLFAGYFIKDQFTQDCPPAVVNHISLKGVKSKKGSTLTIDALLDANTEIESVKKSRTRRKNKDK